MAFCQTPGSRSTHPLGRVLNGLSSIWFGVVMLALIFIYSSVGSALPPIRHGVLADWLGLEFLRFEKTEMQWFCWWPFQVMLGLFCLSMVLSTVRHIRLNAVNAGVWAIHGGIVILAISSAVYFGKKVEGDAVIFHSRALMLAPGMTEPVSMVVRPEAIAMVGHGRSAYQVRVAHIDSQFVISEGAHQGKETPAIWMVVTPMATQQRFARRMLLGYPDETQDFFIEANRVTPASERLGGQKLIDPALQVRLWYDPTDEFYVMDTSAIYARPVSAPQWTQYRLKDMPYRYEYLDSLDAVWPATAEAAPPRRLLDIPAKHVAEARSDADADAQAALKGVSFRVIGYLPYAAMQSRWLPGGSRTNPLAHVQVKAPFSTMDEELLAYMPGQNQLEVPMGPTVEFLWAETPERRTEMAAMPEPRIVVHVKSTQTDRTIAMTSMPTNTPVPVEGTPYAITLKQIIPPGMAGMENSPGAVLIGVAKGEATFNRMVVEGRGDGGLDVDGAMRMLPTIADADLRLEYADGWRNGLRIVAGLDADTVDMVLTGVDGTYKKKQAAVGQAVKFDESALVFTVDRLIPDARQETRPMIVPVAERRPASLARQIHSFVQVEINDGVMPQRAWLRFHEYAFPDAQRAQPSRFLYAPTKVRLGDGRQIELMYSRWREPLPSPIALDRFVLKTYPGGDQPADYISRVRFFENDKWSPITEVRSNYPAAHGGLWYFQAQYDPETLSHTVLGVGNRIGVGWMLGGVCLSIAGMIYAFYVKPGILRRRAARASRSDNAQPEQANQAAPASEQMVMSDAMVS